MLIEFEKYKSLNCKFLSMDDEETFNYNLKAMPQNWTWRDKEISYITNRQGYRCNELEDVNWSNYFITFGDSNVFGIGSHADLIFPNVVGKHLSVDVVNLGIPGCGTDVIYYNLLEVLDKNLPPKFIVISWPNIFRKIWFRESTNYLWIPQLSHTDKSYKGLDDISTAISFEEIHIKKELMYRRLSIKMLCALKKIKLIEFVLPYESSNYSGLEGIKFLDIKQEEKINYDHSEYFNEIRARDYSKKYGSHYGPVYHRMVSNYILDNV